MRNYTLSDAIRAVGGVANATDVHREIRGVTTDSRAVEPGLLFVALAGPSFDGHDFIEQALEKGAAGALSCKTDDVNEYAGSPVIHVSDTYVALRDLATDYRQLFDIPVLAITGSCGKTTTKDLTAAVLGAKYRVTATEGNFNNHIGLPLTLLQLEPQTEFAVVEMGMSGLGEIAALCEAARPTLGLITNVGTAHAGPLGGVENVARAKGELLDCMEADGVAFLNADDKATDGYRKSFDGRIISFGRSKDSDYRMVNEEWLGPDQASITVDRVGTLTVRAFGETGNMNALAAIVVGVHAGLDCTDIQRGLESYAPSAMRGTIQNTRGVTVINDAYNANPVSTASAIDALSSIEVVGKRVAALGDMLELGDGSSAEHEEVGRLCAEAGLSVVCALGEYAKNVIEGAVKSGMEPHRCSVFDDQEAMAGALGKMLEPGDALLVKGSRGMRMEEVIKKLDAIAE